MDPADLSKHILSGIAVFALGIALHSAAHAAAPPEPAVLDGHPDNRPATEDPAPADVGAPLDGEPADVASDGSGSLTDWDTIIAEPDTSAPLPAPVIVSSERPIIPDSQRRVTDYSRRGARNEGLGRTIAGFGVLGGAYVTGVLASFDTGLSAIPVAGAFVVGGSVLTHTEDSLFPGLTTLYGVGMLLNGVSQAIGLGFGIAGAVELGRARRRARLQSSFGGFRLEF